MTEDIEYKFSLRKRYLGRASFLDLERIKKHRIRALAHAEEIEKILNEGNQIIGIDCEMFEYDHSKTTEIGLGYLTKSGVKSEHIIISDFYHLRNGDRVPDNKDNFIFGKSKIMSWLKAESYIKNKFKDSKYVFGHALKGDLSQLGVKSPGQSRFDTANLHMQLQIAKEGVYTNKKTRLSKISETHTPKLSKTPYHNAGNDIHVTGSVLHRLGNKKYVNLYLGKLNESEFSDRYKDDEINRILLLLPKLNEDLRRFISINKISLSYAISNRNHLEKILSSQQNIYRRMLRYGGKDFWEDKVDLGLVGNFFTLATLAPLQKFT
ncbi:hypothetical protein [Marinobacter xestospongiae]|uniref:Gfd2/YDR514C-like C-terminal domain-containing protein n=1 Tax=Marinobacter xestospongiae TaxID=994319 RepID=A0ABU3W3V9_9GAMM|nr:hypothetical protein [Marinobacter xestospongiae]MDV2081235.1 hypothetical protein [Marinobacter xestospongiae]